MEVKATSVCVENAIFEKEGARLDTFTGDALAGP
jgi:hypothetical protein